MTTTSKKPAPRGKATTRPKGRPTPKRKPPAWMPARYTPTLSGTEKFPTHGDWLLKIVDLVWWLPEGIRLELDPWQRWLIRHVLEVYPKGHPRAGRLRFSRVVISMGRQNGKSVLGAIFALYGLLRAAGALVIGIASSVEQARIIYDRLLKVINADADLRSRFKRLTDTRGIHGTNGSRYEVKATKSAAVQGLPVDVGVVDELHLVKPELWSDMVNGTAATLMGIIIGITTAGDDSSTLLKFLYKQMDEEPSERFGFFVWEAPEPEVPADDKELGRYLIAANPALAAKRLSLADAIDDVRHMPPADAIRYRLNRFVSSTNSFITAQQWAARSGTITKPVRPVIVIDRTPDWEWSTITATWKTDDVTYTQVVASVSKPSPERIGAICAQLHRHGIATFAADSLTMKSVLDDLKRRGLPVRAVSLGDVTSAASMFYSKVRRGTIVHAGDPILTHQIPNAIRKNVGDQFRIARKPGTHIDAVIATATGAYLVETVQDVGIQMW